MGCVRFVRFASLFEHGDTSLLTPALADLERRGERRLLAVAHIDIERGLVLHPRMICSGPVG